MARYCKNCGSELSENAAFCMRCGTPTGVKPNIVNGQSVNMNGGAVPAPANPGNFQQQNVQTGPAGYQPQNAQVNQGNFQPQNIQMSQGNFQPQNAQTAPVGYQVQKTQTRVRNQRPFSARFKEAVGEYFKHPAKLLPAVILTAIWIAFSLLGTKNSTNPVIRIINMITYSNGGMYGGILGSIGGIFGKAFFSAVITSLINSLTEKKKAGRSGRRVQAGMQGAALSGLKAVAPFLIGSGAGLALYWFFNITSTPKNLMVAVAGALAAIIAVVRGYGLLFSLVSGIAGSLSKGRIPSLAAVKRCLYGFAAGFAVAVPVTFLRKPSLIIAVGMALLILGILFSVIGKNSAKRAAAMAALIIMVCSILLPLGTAVSAAEAYSDIIGDYTGTIVMNAGVVMDSTYSKYADGDKDIVSFVNKYMGGGSTATLSRDDFDLAFDMLIQNSNIEAVDSKMKIESADPSSGKCTVTFSLAAGSFAWKSKEDVLKLGSTPIEVILNGTYSDGKIEISSGSGDISNAQGTITISKKSGKVTATATDLFILVADKDISYYIGAVQIDVAQKGADSGQKPASSGLTIDDIVGYYLYTGLNYETEEVEDFYFKVEKLSGSTFRLTSLTQSSEEIPEIDWSAIYGDDENTEVTTWSNDVDLTVYHFDQATATGTTDVSITGMRVVEHYEGLGISTETYNSEDKSYCDMSFSRGEDGKILAVYENHFDFGAGYGVMDHWDMVKVDHLPGEAPPEEPVQSEVAEIEPDEEPEDVDPGEPVTDDEPIPELPLVPDDYPDDDYDPDMDDLPDSERGILIDSLTTAIVGGGIGVLLGGIAGALDGDDGSGGDDDSGSDNRPGGGPDIPSGWRIDGEGNISFEDPRNGNTVTYVQTGVDPDTGQPVYHNSENWGQGYDINDLKDMYERTSDEREYYKNIQDTYNKTQEEQREDNQGLSWEAKDWEREKKDNAERERIEDARNKIAYKRGVYDGNVNEFKKAVLKDRNEEYQKQAQYETRAEYMNAGYQTAQTVQKTADVAIDVTEKIASYTPAAPAAKIIKKAYIVSKNAASNVGEYTAGNKNMLQAVTDTAIGAGGDLVKDSADGFGQKLLYNTTMEGGKTVFQGWVDGKSAEEIRDETLKKMEKGFADTVNEATVQGVFGDTPVGTLLTDMANMEANED